MIHELASELYDRLEEVHGKNPNGPSARTEYIEWAVAKLTESEIRDRLSALSV